MTESADAGKDEFLSSSRFSLEVDVATALKPDAPPAGLSGRRPGIGFWLVGYVFAITIAFSAVPAPLYVLYQARDHFGALLVTVIFAVYALGVAVSLHGGGQRIAGSGIGGDRHRIAVAVDGLVRHPGRVVGVALLIAADQAGGLREVAPVGEVDVVSGVVHGLRGAQSFPRRCLRRHLPRPCARSLARRRLRVAD